MATSKRSVEMEQVEQKQGNNKRFELSGEQTELAQQLYKETVAWGGTIYQVLKSKYDSCRMQIEGQILQDGLCSAFDGGRKDKNSQNE